MLWSGVFFIISLIKNIIKPSNITILTDKEKEKLKEFIVNNVYGMITQLRPFSSKEKTVKQNFNTCYFGFGYKNYKTGIPVQKITVN